MGQGKIELCTGALNSRELVILMDMIMIRRRGGGGEESGGRGGGGSILRVLLGGIASEHWAKN